VKTAEMITTVTTMTTSEEDNELRVTIEGWQVDRSNTIARLNWTDRPTMFSNQTILWRLLGLGLGLVVFNKDSKWYQSSSCSCLVVSMSSSNLFNSLRSA
jgi:hypothetical protein